MAADGRRQGTSATETGAAGFALLTGSASADVITFIGAGGGLYSGSTTEGNFGGITAMVGKDVPALALISEVTSKGQIQITCPSVVINTIATIGVVEVALPPGGGGVTFPVNCKGENVVQSGFF